MFRYLRSRIIILVLAVLIAWVFLFYSHSLVSRLDETLRKSNQTIAWFWARTQIPLSLLARETRLAICSECGAATAYSGGTDSVITAFCPECDALRSWFIVDRWPEEDRNMFLDQTRNVFRTLVQRLDYPTVLTDREGNPQVVNGIPVTGELSDSERVHYRQLIETLDDAHDPIPLVRIPGDTVGMLHYGTGSLQKELALVPYLELGLLIILAAALFYGLRLELRREKEMAWAGFAKETAHQLSTPLSSLMGWLEILRDLDDPQSAPEADEALEAMGDDVERLRQIAARYSQMGKRPALVEGSVNGIIETLLAYFRSRPGLLAENVTIQTQLDSKRTIRLSPVLLGWVFENLLKNALAAIPSDREGVVTISSDDEFEDEGLVRVQFEDNGVGIPFRSQGRIFKAGFTTRTGGWGLGLPLSRRIIEEYHGGKIRLKASAPGKGSVFEICLPIAGSQGDDDHHTLG